MQTFFALFVYLVCKTIAVTAVLIAKEFSLRVILLLPAFSIRRIFVRDTTLDEFSVSFYRNSLIYKYLKFFFPLIAALVLYVEYIDNNFLINGFYSSKRFLFYLFYFYS